MFLTSHHSPHSWAQSSSKLVLFWIRNIIYIEISRIMYNLRTRRRRRKCRPWIELCNKEECWYVSVIWYSDGNRFLVRIVTMERQIGRNKRRQFSDGIPILRNIAYIMYGVIKYSHNFGNGREQEALSIIIGTKLRQSICFLPWMSLG